MRDNRKAYEKMIDAQLEEWNIQVALFKSKADEVIAEAQIEFQKKLRSLKAQAG